MTVFASVFALTIPANASAREEKSKIKLAALPADLAIPPALDLERLMEEEARRIQAIRHRRAVRLRARKRAAARRRAAQRRAAALVAQAASYADSTSVSSATASSGSAPSGALQAIAKCESGGDPGAISAGGTYRGKYQFSQSTWNSVGGSGDPAAATETEQDRRAAILYRTGGPGHWPTCGR